MYKLINEVAGIMKSARADDEKIRTIAKMEKVTYYKSKQPLNKKLSFL